MAPNEHNPKPDPHANSSGSSYGSIIPPNPNKIYPYISNRCRFPTNYNLPIPDLPLPYNLYHPRAGPLEVGSRIREDQRKRQEQAARDARDRGLREETLRVERRAREIEERRGRERREARREKVRGWVGMGKGKGREREKVEERKVDRGDGVAMGMGELEIEDIEMEKGRVVEGEEERYAHLPFEKRPDLRFAALREKVAAQLKTEAGDRENNAAKENGGLDKLVQRLIQRAKKPDLQDKPFKLVLHGDGFVEHVLTVSRSVLPSLFPDLFPGKRHNNRAIPAPSLMSTSPPDVLLTRAINNNRLRHLSDGSRGGVWVVEKGETAKEVVVALFALNEEARSKGAAEWELLGWGEGGCEGRWYMIHECESGEGKGRRRRMSMGWLRGLLG
ncbi:hypothetical protein MMC30_006088 [Trapelia coarctata]|nr:hypothetical protein [Trapelia coarctata]